MAFNQFDVATGFKTGRDAAKSSGILDAFGASEEERKSRIDLDTYRQKKEIDKQYTPTSSSRDKYYDARTQEILNPKVQPNKGVYTFNKATGETTQTGSIPKNARIFTKDSPTGNESFQLSNIDSMKENIGHIRTILNEDPNMPIKSKIPFVGQQYKAYFNSLRRQIALETGGKNLTENELRIVSSNLPNETDIFDPKAMDIKLGIIEKVLEGTQSRLSGGSFNSQQGSEIQQSGTSGQPPVADDWKSREETLRKRYSGL